MIRSAHLFAVLLALLPTAGFADGLADKLFVTTDHDFGKVQRGERLLHSFPLTNTTGQELRIKRIRVSCGCTQASASSERIAPNESATIDAVMDTSTFQGSKSVTIYVQFERPWRAEAALRVSAVSLGTLSSGQTEVDFGIIPVGAKAVKKLNLDYSGNPGWQITGVDYGNKQLKAEVTEVSRDSSLVRYEMNIELAETAATGTFEDKIRIHTNDSANSEVIVLVKAKIEPKLSTAPDHLHLKNLIAGQKVTKNVVVKAGDPFKVVRVENTKGMFEVRSSPEAKRTQLVVLTLTVPEDPSQIPGHVEIVTDLPDNQSVSVGIRD